MPFSPSSLPFSLPPSSLMIFRSAEEKGEEQGASGEDAVLNWGPSMKPHLH